MCGERNTQTSVYSEPHTEAHNMKDLTVDGDKETHIYEIPQLNPVREKNHHNSVRGLWNKQTELITPQEQGECTGTT